jgi:hypothetical protein
MLRRLTRVLLAFIVALAAALPVSVRDVVAWITPRGQDFL